MNNTVSSHDDAPWYKQGWPWLLIALPASAVFGGIATIIIAVQSPNAMVVDDYYKEGLAINQNKQRHAAASAMQLSGLLRSDTRNVSVKLSTADPVPEEKLILQLIHATRAELDQSIELYRDSDGTFSAAIAELSAGNWYLKLSNEKQTWEIRSRITVDGPFQAHLTPAT